jgi:hydroxymethylglutaryl-CoA lyase
MSSICSTLILNPIKKRLRKNDVGIRQLNTTSRHRLYPPRPYDRGAIPGFARIVEVGPRDGLQNEKTALTVGDKITLVEKLISSGLTNIEAGSMVSKLWVPQMADSSLVLQGFPKSKRKEGLRLSVLTPNIKGFEAAVEAGADEVAVFAAATDAFSLKNINCGVLDSLNRFKPVLAAAESLKIPVRGYVSCVVGCPYSGAVEPSAVGHVAAELLKMGCYEISLGDTIGVGTPWSIKRMLVGVVSECGVDVTRLALHAHDTMGMGMANVVAALDEGVRVFDSSVGGLGGCPYAGGGASGNIATEDLIYLLHGLGVQTNVDMDMVIDAADFITKKLGVSSRSRAGTARASRRNALLSAAKVFKDSQNANDSVTDAAAVLAAKTKAESSIALSELALKSWPEKPSESWTDEKLKAEHHRQVYIEHHALERLVEKNQQSHQ